MGQCPKPECPKSFFSVFCPRSQRKTQRRLAGGERQSQAYAEGGRYEFDGCGWIHKSGRAGRRRGQAGQAEASLVFPEVMSENCSPRDSRYEMGAQHK